MEMCNDLPKLTLHVRTALQHHIDHYMFFPL